MQIIATKSSCFYYDCFGVVFFVLVISVAVFLAVHVFDIVVSIMVDFDHVQIIATILTLRSTVCDKNSLLNNAKKVTIEDLKTTGTFRIPANFCQEFNTPIRFRLNRKTIKKKKTFLSPLLYYFDANTATQLYVSAS